MSTLLLNLNKQENECTLLLTAHVHKEHLTAFQNKTTNLFLHYCLIVSDMYTIKKCRCADNSYSTIEPQDVFTKNTT